MRAEKIPRLTGILAQQIAGLALVWMKKQEYYLHRQVLPLMIFMAANEKVRVYSRIAYWLLMHLQEN